MDSEEGKKEGEVSPSPGARGRGSAICERPGLSAIPREQVEESGAWTVVPANSQGVGSLIAKMRILA